MTDPRVTDPAERTGADARFRSLLDSAPDPILGVDGAGRIVFANRETSRVFGHAPAELIGRPIELLVPDRFRDRHERLRADYHRAPTTRPMGAGLALSARRRDGTEFPVEISLSPMADERDPLTVVIVRDVTERRLVEAERARERAEVDRLKDDLASMIVHDLKNPVNGIVMMVHAMLRRVAEVSDRQRANLGAVEQTCRELLRLIQNLLEIAKIEAGKMPVEREPVDVGALARTVLGEYEPMARQVGKRVVLAVGGDLPLAVADVALLKRVLVNLVANAIRHSGAREVRVEAAPTPDALAIRVRDDGHGIPPEDHDRIFEKFSSARRNAGGEPSADTGLGLPFCKLAVELMGGRIHLSSVPGSETVFAVHLPLHAAT